MFILNYFNVDGEIEHFKDIVERFHFNESIYKKHLLRLIILQHLQKRKEKINKPRERSWLKIISARTHYLNSWKAILSIVQKNRLRKYEVWHITEVRRRKNRHIKSFILSFWGGVKVSHKNVGLPHSPWPVQVFEHERPGCSATFCNV